MFSLETVKVKTPFCNNNAAVITCNDNESNIDGNIIKPHQNSISILFNPLTPSIGLQLGTYTIIYEKNITDYSIRVTTFTFYELVDFNGTTLQCGHKYMFMDFQYRGK